MPGVSERLLDVILWIFVEERRIVAEEESIGVNGSGERLREPVERDAVEDLVERRRLVGPLEELLADPAYISARNHCTSLV